MKWKVEVYRDRTVFVNCMTYIVVDPHNPIMLSFQLVDLGWTIRITLPPIIWNSHYRAVVTPYEQYHDMGGDGFNSGNPQCMIQIRVVMVMVVTWVHNDGKEIIL